MKPTLHIKSDEKGLISIFRGEGVDKQSWEKVVLWWLDTTPVQSSHFEVPIDSFLSRMSWLRSSWNQDGGAVDVDIQTRNIITNAHEHNKEFKNLLAGNINADMVEVQSLQLKRELTTFQQENVSKLIAVRSGANFSVPGAGKTSTAIGVWVLLRSRGDVNRLLVVCPRSAFEAWETEPDKILLQKTKTQIFSTDTILSSTEILIVNYEKLENIHNLERIKIWLKKYSSMMILDEAHRVKGGGQSVRWRRCKELSLIVKRVDLLSGTPMPQGYDDLRNLFSLTWPAISKTYLTDETLSKIKRGTLFVRTTKDELSLPPIEIYREELSMGNQQKEIYSALCKVYTGNFILSLSEESYFGSKGRAVMSLMAAATNPGLLAGISNEDAFMGLEWPPRDVSVAKTLLDLVENYASFEIPSKYIWISNFCEKASRENRKVLIWSNLIGNIKALAKLLTPFHPAVVYGAVSQDDRKLQLYRFRNDINCHVLISNPQTLGEGVSLHHECHEAIYLDRSYNAGHYLQSLDRIHRLGLPPSQITKVYILQSKNTIDLRIASRLEQKIMRLSKALNDDGLSVVSLPDDDLVLPNDIVGLDQLDLDDLFSHLKSHG